MGVSKDDGSSSKWVVSFWVACKTHPKKDTHTKNADTTLNAEPSKEETATSPPLAEEPHTHTRSAGFRLRRPFIFGTCLFSRPSAPNFRRAPMETNGKPLDGGHGLGPHRRTLLRLLERLQQPAKRGGGVLFLFGKGESLNRSRYRNYFASSNPHPPRSRAYDCEHGCVRFSSGLGPMTAQQASLSTRDFKHRFR